MCFELWDEELEDVAGGKTIIARNRGRSVSVDMVTMRMARSITATLVCSGEADLRGLGGRGVTGSWFCPLENRCWLIGPWIRLLVLQEASRLSITSLLVI